MMVRCSSLCQICKARKALKEDVVAIMMVVRGDDILMQQTFTDIDEANAAVVANNKKGDGHYYLLQTHMPETLSYMEEDIPF